MPEAKSRDRAVIWDMDGVIVDTAPYHFESWRYVFSKREARFGEEDFRRNFGRRNDAIIRYTLGEGITGEEIDTIAREKEEYFRKVVAPNVKPLPGVMELLESLRKRGFRMALATSAPVENIDLLLGTLGIKHLFDAIASGREVAESKPSPQLFLLAASKLGVDPQHCVVIEDAVAGVEAARRAGMRCVAVTTTNHRELLSAADLVVVSLEEISVDDLERLVNR